MDVVPDPTTAQLLQIEGMRSKLQEYKRFKAQYASNLRLLEEMTDVIGRVRRENRKLRIALAEIALSRPKTSTVGEIAKYAAKVFAGLGYNLKEIELFKGRFF